MRRRFQASALRLMVGRMERYGLPAPDHPFGSAHPTVSDDVLSRIAHGEITPKPNLAELGERTVRFADGSEAEADVIVYCTGYRVTFPFFDPELISAPDNDLPLFRRVFHPDVPGVYFVGLLQPLGAVMPLAELQSGWICDHLAGRYALPDRRRCSPTWRPSAPRCSSATCPRSATRCRSTSRTTCSRRRRRAARRGGAARGVSAGRRERTKAANRAAIVAAARDAFGELGFEAAGVRDIVRRTGLASGTFYNYFTSTKNFRGCCGPILLGLKSANIHGADASHPSIGARR